MSGHSAHTQTILVPQEAVYNLKDVLELMGAILGMEVANDLEHSDPDVGWQQAEDFRVYFNKHDDTPDPELTFARYSPSTRIDDLQITINGLSPNEWMVQQVIDQEAGA